MRARDTMRNAITSREWTLASDWREVPITAELMR